MKGKIGVITILTLVLLMTSMIGSQIDTSADGEPTRAAGEHLEIDVDVDFDGPLRLDVDVTINVFELFLNGSMITAEDIRTGYGIDPTETLFQVNETLWSRAENLTEASFQGDTFTVISGDPVLTSLDNTTNSPEDPVIYTMSLSGVSEIERYLDPSRASLIGEGREDLFITSLFMSGFKYQRTVSLIALAGEIVTYNVPSSFDPLGDGAVTLSLGSNTHTHSGGYYTVVQDGLSAQTESYFTFMVSAMDVAMIGDEEIDGSILVDWEELDSMSIGGVVDINTISTSRSQLLSSVPPSMSVPDVVSASFIRYAHLEGILTSDDIEEINEQIEDEVETPLRDTLDDQSLEATSDLDTGIVSITLPTTGTELKTILDSTDPVTSEIGTDTDISLDILKDYNKEDVMGLLNGGMRIGYDLDPLNDNRFDLRIKTPAHIVLGDEVPLNTDGDRRTYEYTHGRKMVSSSLAPVIDGEILSITGFIDVSQIRSWYLADIEMDIEANITFGLGAMKFDSEDLELDTEMEVELDYLTSDIIRLLMDMEIVDRKEIEDSIEGDFQEEMNDLLPDEDDSFFIDIKEESLVFDGDYENMDGSEPLFMQIGISGTISPMKMIQDAGNDENDGENQILPFHLDPILPYTTRKEKMELDNAANWTIDLKISLPSGIGIKAWLIKDEVKVKDLDVDTSEGYPTVHFDISPGEADTIGLEVSFGTYTLVNNIGACFACCLIGLIIMVLIIVLIILKIARKKKSKSDKKEENEEKDKKEKKKDKKKDKKNKVEDKDPDLEEEVADGEEEEMGWD